MKQTACQDKIIIRRKIGSNCLRLSVNRHGQIVLTMPFFCLKTVAERFIKEHQDWIDTQKKKVTTRLTFQDGQNLTLLGQSLTIKHNPSNHQPTRIEDNYLVVGGDITFLHRRVSDFVRRQTATYIDCKAREMADRIGHRINRISLKDTTSRWGSCSGKKNLNFCWRLGLAPPYVLDYIIAHEVSHLQEMNHSQRFWRVVSQLCDKRADAEIWLRRHGHTLR